MNPLEMCIHGHEQSTHFTRKCCCKGKRFARQCEILLSIVILKFLGCKILVELPSDEIELFGEAISSSQSHQLLE